MEKDFFRNHFLDDSDHSSDDTEALSRILDRLTCISNRRNSEYLCETYPENFPRTHHDLHK